MNRIVRPRSLLLTAAILSIAVSASAQPLEAFQPKPEAAMFGGADILQTWIATVGACPEPATLTSTARGSTSPVGVSPWFGRRLKEDEASPLPEVGGLERRREIPELAIQEEQRRRRHDPARQASPGRDAGQLIGPVGDATQGLDPGLLRRR
jgi:hypothetical protein